MYENNCEAKNIDHLVKRIKQKAKEVDQEMLQGMIEGVREEAPSYVARWTIFSSFKIWFFVALAMLFLIKKNSAFHLLKWLNYETQHFSKDFCNAC